VSGARGKDGEELSPETGDVMRYGIPGERARMPGAFEMESLGERLRGVRKYSDGVGDNLSFLALIRGDVGG
jgi:hypothetical protein